MKKIETRSKICLCCGVKFNRPRTKPRYIPKTKEPTGRLEGIDQWRKRKYCSHKCHKSSRDRGLNDAGRRVSAVEAENKYRKNNVEKLKAYSAQYRDKNKDRIAAFRDGNREKTRAASLSWNRRNQARVYAACAQYRAAKLKRTPAWADLEKIEQIYKLAEQAAQYAPEPLHVDHIVPLQGENVSGLHVHENLQILKRSENLAKSNRWSDEP